MHFIDEVWIEVKAGDGGKGCVAFRREAHVPRGGPSGGDGGDGGDVVLLADSQLLSLLDFKYRRHYRASSGEDGRGRDQYGRRGDDLHLRVPVGTVVYNAETGEVLADLNEAASSYIVARGGRGGRGNLHFSTPWNQAPRQAESGSLGEQRTVRLELKLLADIGIVGFPSVGKSTIIAAVSRARPKIAQYPFTTLVPNLGVVYLSNERSMIVADIPGLIEGAAEGAGLGHRFLRHVERTTVLLHLIEAHQMVGEGRDAIKDFDILNTELRKYAPELAHKRQLVALNKIDLTDTRERFLEFRQRFAERGIELYPVSAVTGEGMRELLEALWDCLHQSRGGDSK